LNETGGRVDAHDDEDEGIQREKQEVGSPKETIELELQQLQIPVNNIKPPVEWKTDSGSTSSDLDRTFSPDIVSVSSDITDVSYHNISTRKSNRPRSWRKWKKIREGFAESCRQNQPSSPMSFLDIVLDTICGAPATGPAPAPGSGAGAGSRQGQ
jgi:hypothetical protein